MDKTLAQILISFYHIFSTFITLSIFVAFVTSKFTTNYELCVAEASLLQASIVLEVEKSLNKKQQVGVSAHYKRFCVPYVTNLKTQSEKIHEKETFGKLELTQRRIGCVEDGLKGYEGRYNASRMNKEDEIFATVSACNEQICDGQEKLALSVLKDLEDVSQKQNFMNRNLSKLLRDID